MRAGRALTARLGLADRVTHEHGDALALDVAPGAFDLIWTQNSGMNIEDKARLYAGFARVLRPGGRSPSRSRWPGPSSPSSTP